MLEIKYIRENTEDVIARLAQRNFDGKEVLAKAVETDALRRTTQKELDATQAEANSIARQIGTLFKENKQEDAAQLKVKSGALKEKGKQLQERFNNAEKELNKLLCEIPNLPHSSVPTGETAEANEIMHEEGLMPGLDANAKPHWELGVRYGILDFEAGNKITGAGFPVIVGKGARLERALVNFFLDEALAAGYKEVLPPLLVNKASAFGTGQLPDKEGQMYELKDEKFYLIPTAEVPITNYFRNEILKPEDLPVKMAGYTPCFRREAGSYGKDVRGLNRVHQFDKVEVVQIAHPDNSYRTLDEMTEYVSGLLRKLELPFRTVKLCGGDLGFASALTYDMEVWSAAQQKWLEVSSVSNFETFQSNRMKLRIKDSDGKTKLAHTLNGSALALPRIVAALLENNQTPEGIKLPEAVVKYTGFSIID